MFKRFLALRKTNPVWFWLIIIGTIGTIFLVIAVIVLFTAGIVRVSIIFHRAQIEGSPEYNLILSGKKNTLPTEEQIELFNDLKRQLRIQKPNWTDYTIHVYAIANFSHIRTMEQKQLKRAVRLLMKRAKK